MAQTITQKTPEALCRIATGAYLDTGTVAAYNFDDLGFKQYIESTTASGDEKFD